MVIYIELAYPSGSDAHCAFNTHITLVVAELPK